jgi:hypothetical protein
MSVSEEDRQRLLIALQVLKDKLETAKPVVVNIPKRVVKEKPDMVDHFINVVSFGQWLD